MELKIEFNELNNVTTGENLLKGEVVRLTEVSSDTIEVQFENVHSIAVGNLIVVDIIVFADAKKLQIKIMGKITEVIEESQKRAFGLKLQQYNSEVWHEILRVLEQKQNEINVQFKLMRGH